MFPIHHIMTQLLECFPLHFLSNLILKKEGEQWASLMNDLSGEKLIHLNDVTPLLSPIYKYFAAEKNLLNENSPMT